MDNSAYIRCPEGSRNTIVFIHGICGTPRHFDDFIPLVPEDWSIYNILLEGHGRSVDEFSASTMSAWKMQVDRLLQRLNDSYDRIVIVAHSMGTLFALEAAQKYPHIRQLILLAVPLRIVVKPRATWNSLRVIFQSGSQQDPYYTAAQKTYGIEPDKRLWKYLRWLPNYWHLLQESRRVRKRIRNVTTPAAVFQSQLDELVSTASQADFPAHFLQITLQKSSHFYYEPYDYRLLLQCFSAIVKNQNE